MEPVDCACVIHGDKYDWLYVEKLNGMLQRNFSRPVRLHVWTESSRTVAPGMIHHPLEEWTGVSGPRKSWWYKMQMFAPGIKGRIFYFDLDVVIVGNLDWMLDLDPEYFWTVRDFRYLWKPQKYSINSSIMIWDTERFDWIWKEFSQRGPDAVIRRHPGDQDYLDRALPPDRVKYLPETQIRSWRWQVLDGGYDRQQKTYRAPGTGPTMTEQDRVIVFHGDPKPDQIEHPAISSHWR